MSQRPLINGVNLIGFFHSQLGLGESCRLTARTLDAAGIPYAKISTEKIFGHLADDNLSVENNRLHYPINLLCIGQGNIRPFFSDRFSNILKNNYNIAMWFWETNYLPWQLHAEIAYLDEIWVTSRYMENYLKTQISKPVYYIPQPFEVTSNKAKITKQDLGLSDKFMFLFCFDYNSTEKRKNPGAVVEAFLKAFPDNPNVQLVIKSQNSNGRHLACSYYPKIANDSRITWIDKTVPRENKYDLIKVCDCYVSLHRSEGFGLTMAEAMHFEKPTIGTGFSGNLDFMHPNNSYLCSHRIVTIGRDAGFYPRRGQWADPDVDHAASLMQEVYNNPQEALEKGKKGKQYLAEKHAIPTIAKEIGQRLQSIVPKPGRRSLAFYTRHLGFYTKFQIRRILKPYYYSFFNAFKKLPGP